jgi:hypothetical protein
MSVTPIDRRPVPAALASARARRWAVEGPAGLVALDGVGLTAAARHGWALVPLEPAHPAEPPVVRAAAGREPVRWRMGALRLASACLWAGLLATVSTIGFGGGLALVGAGHLPGTLLPPALAILAWRALAALTGLAREGETGS